MAAAALVINEFLPDPAGSDGGREFVELLNTGATAVDLEEVAFQFANGSVGADWVTRWRGRGYGSLAPGGRFLLVDRNWQGERGGDAEAYLGLQNGPDAIRLVDGTTVLDLIGYGALTDVELFEGEPVGVVSGLALARRPDGHDSGCNALDLVSVQPTPGVRNFQPYSVAVVDLAWEPAVLERPGDTLRLNLSLANNGTEELPAGPCRLVWASGEVDSWWDGARPDQELSLVFLARLTSRGSVDLTWEYPVPGQTEILQVPLGRAQVGTGNLRLNEIMPAPAQGQGEWLELAWLGSVPTDLAGYQVRDQDGAWSVLPPAMLVPGELFIAAQDSTALVLWMLANQAAGRADCLAGGDAVQILSLAGWPSLNNTPPEDREYADRVYLANPDGMVIDAVAWGGPRYELPERGLSLERIGPEPVNPGAGNWAVCTARVGSTPGCANSVTVPPGQTTVVTALQVVPPVLDFSAGDSAVHFRFVLAGAEVAWELRIFNLWGDEVRDFGGDAHGTGPRDLLWAGRDDRDKRVGAGAYLVWLETRSAGGAIVQRGTTRMVVR